MDLAKALARVDVLTAGQAASSQVDEAQLRPLQTECEALKDEVTNKDRKPTGDQQLAYSVWGRLDVTGHKKKSTATVGAASRVF